jgi:hypothetical protein
MKLPIVFGLALLLSGCGEIGDTEVEDAWIRLPAVQGRPGAAYFHIRTGKDAETLLAVATPAAIRSEMHETTRVLGGKTGAGAMTMTPLPSLTVPAASSLTFAPGGKHVMLYDVSPALKAGDTAKLALKFADGDTWEGEATVVGAGDPAPSPGSRQ